MLSSCKLWSSQCTMVLKDSNRYIYVIILYDLQVQSVNNHTDDTAKSASIKMVNTEKRQISLIFASALFYKCFMCPVTEPNNKLL